MEVRFTVTAGLISALIVSALGWIYWQATRALPELAIFVAASSAAAAAIVSALYAGRGIRQTGEVLEEDKEDRKKVLAFQFTSKWNDPAMFYVRDTVRELMKLDHNSDEFKKLVEDRETNVIHFLNFLEEVAIAIEEQMANDHILKEAFCEVMVNAWGKLGTWVVAYRTTLGWPRVWRKLEDLADKWA